MKQFFFVCIAFLSLFLIRCNSGTEDKAAETPGADSTYDAVLIELERKINQYPDSALLYNDIIDTLANRNDYKAAAEWCNRLINRGADSNYYYWFIKGDLNRRGGFYDSAIAAYQTYLSKFPDDEQVLLNLANTYAEAGNKNAIDLASMLAARFPTREMRGEAAFIKGVYYNQKKQFENARQWLDTTILLNYTYSEAYMEKGYSYFDEAKFQQAFNTFNTLAQINSGYADAWYWMAKSKEAMGKPDEAIKYYENAYSLDHSITEALDAIIRLNKKTALRLPIHSDKIISV